MLKKNIEQLEMVPCPVCGKPMPRKRMELGYNYCVNCSTEGRKVCLVEGTQEGDGVQSDIVIMTQQEARAINRSKLNGTRPDQLEDEASLDMKTFEEREVAEEEVMSQDRLLELEGEFGAEISEKTAQDMETMGIFAEDDELSAEFPGLNEEEDI